MTHVDDLIVGPQESLKGALRRMTDNRKGVIFVCDADAHLVGALSDGDVRRSLLDDTLLVAPVSKVMNVDPLTAADVPQATSMLQHYAVAAVPVVDSRGRVQQIVVSEPGGSRVLDRVTPFPPEEPAVTLNALALIPARGGSKRVPRKNLAVVGGRSLVGWAIQAAKQARHARHVIVSTDSAEIADAARVMGVDVPWLRPESLARDESKSIDVVIHAFEWATANLRPAPEFGVLLEPTAPLRRAEHIDAALELLASSGADSVVTVSELPHNFHPEEVLRVDEGRLQPFLPGRTMDTRKLRSEQAPAYVPNGLVYAFRVESLLRHRSLFGQSTLPLVLPWSTFLDIDTMEDLKLAEQRIAQLVDERAMEVG